MEASICAPSCGIDDVDGACSMATHTTSLLLYAYFFRIGQIYNKKKVLVGGSHFLRKETSLFSVSLVFFRFSSSCHFVLSEFPIFKRIESQIFALKIARTTKDCLNIYTTITHKCTYVCICLLYIWHCGLSLAKIIKKGFTLLSGNKNMQ